MKAVEKEVRRILSRVVMVPEASLTPEAELAELGVNSLDHIECVMALEEIFQLELEDADISRLRTVQDIIDAVGRAQAAASC